VSRPSATGLPVAPRSRRFRERALWGILERIIELGIQVIHLHLVAPLAPSQERAQTVTSIGNNLAADADLM